MSSTPHHGHGHGHSHLARRASVSTAPYTIPERHQQHAQQPFHQHSYSPSPSLPGVAMGERSASVGESASESASASASATPGAAMLSPPPPHAFSPHQIPNHNSSQQIQMSSSVPLLSREFVVRRISEGESGRLKEELKCEACGKGYKHISSLAKHLWEHTPEWNVTKKLLISKHQQVQLLEAASILVSMNEFSLGSNSNSNSNSPKISRDVVLEEDEREEEDRKVGDRSRSSSPEAKFRTDSISQIPQSSMLSASPTKIKTEYFDLHSSSRPQGSAEGDKHASKNDSAIEDDEKSNEKNENTNEIKQSKDNNSDLSNDSDQAENGNGNGNGNDSGVFGMED